MPVMSIYDSLMDGNSLEWRLMYRSDGDVSCFRERGEYKG